MSRASAAWLPQRWGGLGYWNHPGGRFPKGGHIQGLALAGLLPGGMNFLPLSNPPGSDRGASPALAPRSSALSFWSTPAETKARLCPSSGQIKASALRASRCGGESHDQPGCRSLFRRALDKPAGAKGLKDNAEGPGVCRSLFSGTLGEYAASLRFAERTTGAQDLKIMLRIHALRAGSGSVGPPGQIDSMTYLALLGRMS